MYFYSAFFLPCAHLDSFQFSHPPNFQLYRYHKLLGHDIADQPLPVTLPRNYNAPNLPQLNESQTNALRKVLTAPLALIQGPPGTGKTVTSATLVRTFLFFTVLTVVDLDDL